MFNSIVERVKNSAKSDPTSLCIFGVTLGYLVTAFISFTLMFVFDNVVGFFLFIGATFLILVGVTIFMRYDQERRRKQRGY